MRSGAFSPLTANPVLQALVLPFGGIGLLSIVEVMAWG